MQKLSYSISPQDLFLRSQSDVCVGLKESQHLNKKKAATPRNTASHRLSSRPSTVLGDGDEPSSTARTILALPRPSGGESQCLPDMISVGVWVMKVSIVLVAKFKKEPRGRGGKPGLQYFNTTKIQESLWLRLGPMKRTCSFPAVDVGEK